jgi:pyridinium-3,5-biscarboxylic acid mononucleotide synthase
MRPDRIREIIENTKSGKISVGQAMKALKSLPFEDMGFAVVDHHRELRAGFPEVIYCEGKTVKQVIAIAQRILKAGSDLLATRADEKLYRSLKKELPDAVYHKEARVITVRRNKDAPQMRGSVAVVCAGTSDIPVAEEAAVTAEALGNEVIRIYDVGVAGLHRLLARRDDLFNAEVIIVVAGMEGALASVVGGLVECPVVAVPTSIGYGASFNGLAALLAMLNSCASGVTVVNIDNGFGAGYAASVMNRVR